ncbi:hypothetical protein [Nocardioides albus]|uniref:Endonuclease/exonuclease/phosphatase domain-containing protein n=1 Tax=Nocardioides albus TaxID=1841 RepID=A0A7W5F9T2_9ACTN|nr:hypothetical protein [Nocardioides albus]MBB3090386.1 hypothetical protein [Nocardioides albus]
MSFNIRYDREGTQPGQPDYWPERKPLVTAFVELEKPTILGVQKAEFGQLGAIEAGLGPKYRMLGFGRDGTRIDWILTTPGITVKEAAINTWTKDGRWPSDHTPVQALVRLPSGS